MSSPKAEDLSSVLDYMSNKISQHVIYQSEHYPNVIALWAVGSYLMDHWSRFPKLLIVSPERECGKTTALETIEALFAKDGIQHYSCSNLSLLTKSLPHSINR